MNLYCVVDCQPIPPERVAKKAVTCSQECADEYRRQRRQERAEKKCRLCGRPFRQRRSTAGVLHEHSEVAEVVTPSISTRVDSLVPELAFLTAVTSETEQHPNLKALIGSVETVEKLCTVDKHFIAESFTEQSNSQRRVEELLTVGAELPVVGDQQAVNTISTCSPVETVEMSENEVCQ